MKDNFYHSLPRLVVAVLLCMVSAINALADEGVILTLKSGQEVGFLFTRKPSIITSDTALAISTGDGQEVSYDYAEVRSIRLGAIIETGLDKTPAQEPTSVTFKVDDSMLNVYNLPVGVSVSIYTLNGHCLATQSQTTDGATMSIPLNDKGVLVVRTSNGISYRILNQ